MNKISSQNLERATTLTKDIEVLSGELALAQGTVVSLQDKLNPLQKELDGIMGYKAFKSPSRFSDEQRAKISAGLKAKWAERKAKAAMDSSIPVNA